MSVRDDESPSSTIGLMSVNKNRKVAPQSEPGAGLLECLGFGPGTDS